MDGWYAVGGERGRSSPMNRKVYSAAGIVHVKLDLILKSRQKAEPVVIGVDVGKHELMAVLRWSDGCFERPWRVSNPNQIGLLRGLIVSLSQGRQLTVAMESTGTYGDALRQAMDDAQIAVHLVSGKRAHDYAEVFDGTPSQHDGKDAAVAAELCALGKSSVWKLDRGDDRSQRIELLVDQMAAAVECRTRWTLRLEGLLARHWPEASAVLGCSAGTMLKAMKHYGGPEALAKDPQALGQLRHWSSRKLSEQKLEDLIGSARTTTGVRLTRTDVQRIRWCAGEGLTASMEASRCRRELIDLAKDHDLIARQGEAIGVATACVLWRYLGDPRRYHCAAAYRKAMGLNLKERSSGRYQGQLKISKRGSGRVRQWLYLSALRLIRNEPRASKWYRRKLRKGGGGKRRLIMALTRKLALSMWAVSKSQQLFDVDRMLGPTGNKSVRKKAAGKQINRKQIHAKGAIKAKVH